MNVWRNTYWNPVNAVLLAIQVCGPCFSWKNRKIDADTEMFYCLLIQFVYYFVKVLSEIFIICCLFSVETSLKTCSKLEQLCVLSVTGKKTC